MADLRNLRSIIPKRLYIPSCSSPRMVVMFLKLVICGFFPPVVVLAWEQLGNAGLLR